MAPIRSLRAPRIARVNAFGLAMLALTAFAGPLRAAEPAVTIPAPVESAPEGEGPQTAILAGGCFWGVQAVYQHTNGVINAVSGYAGGSAETATYERVSRGTTAHAESVQITYDPAKISYGKILQIFFSVAHNPTYLNRQGADTGPQYRSAIFVQNATQRKIAESYIAQLNAAKVFSKPIATRVDRFKGFFAAEDYHQDYATIHPTQPYIVYNDAPKIENLKRLFSEQYRAEPVLVGEAKTH